MKKIKGFTLVELLAVIAILGIIALIAIPTIDKSINEGKNQMLETQKAQIIKGVKDYLALNTDKLPDTGESEDFFVGDIQNAGFLQLNILNPANDDYISPAAKVTVKAIGNGYKYTVDESTLSGNGGTSSDKPIITLNGGPVQYVEMGSNFEDNGYTAVTQHGADITANVRTVIKNKAGTVVSSIATNTLTTYTIDYTVTDPNNSSLSTTAKKTVMIVDTTKPVITLSKGDYIEMTAMEVATYNFKSLATATDNSGTVKTFNYSGNISQIGGTYYIIFTAKDSSGNTATRKVIIKVNQGIIFNIPDAGHFTDEKKVTITFPTYSGSYKNQYSLNGGQTWVDVSSSSTTFTLNKTTLIIARLFDGESSTLAVTNTVTNFNNE